MIADESDSDLNDPKECKTLDTIFNHAIAPGWSFTTEKEGYNKQSSQQLMTNSTVWLNNCQNLIANYRFCVRILVKRYD
jgi:hypothetical protein